MFWAKKAEKVKILEKRPVAERHDSKKHEDSADANDEHNHHDYGVAVALFYYSHTKKDMRACKKSRFERDQKAQKQR